MAGKHWTKEEEQQLTELYKTNTVKEISNILDRTESSILSKLKRLKVGKPEVTLEKVNIKVKLKFPNLEFLEYNGARELSLIRDNNCGHTWYTRPGGVYSKNDSNKCPICNHTTVKYTDEILNTKISNKYPNILNAKINNKHVHLVYTCGHFDTTTLSGLLNNATKSVCRICTPQMRKKKSQEQIVEEIRLVNPDIELLEEYINCRIYIQVRSKSCGHKWKIQPSNFIAHSTGTKCPICNNIGSSKGERALSNILEKYTEVETGDRSILEGLEIDIYLPQLKLGIEYNGEYWHSEEKKGKNYHLDKTKVAEKQGIRLIHIFEHEWLQKQDIVKSRLLGMLQQNYKLGARKCKVEELPFVDVRNFLNENHLQGCGSPSKHNLGLYYKDILVAVMTFSKPRFNSNYDYELIRYASLTGINVQGGASKLLKYFTSKYKGSIVSYSDKRWSQGNLYKTLGFEYSHTSDPGYFYAKNGDILSRYRCQKHKLKGLFPSIYKNELTETEIMSAAGYYKVYDCGNDVWVYGTKE